ncbi:hypothetical protein KW787_00750 [Candidatus Pacearchaeota archaeon]|nr:hypothetical protein [Candidatus Pacearchaeota archaeon]
MLDPSQLLVIVATIVVVLCIALIIFQRRLIPHAPQTIDKNTIFTSEVDNVGKTRSSREMLDHLNKTVKEYLRETYSFAPHDDYAEMIDSLYRKRKNELVHFCQKMLKALYSGDEIRRPQVEALTNEFLSILNKAHEKEIQKDQKQNEIKIQPTPQQSQQQPPQSPQSTPQPAQTQPIQKKEEVKEEAEHKAIGSMDVLERIEKKLTSKINTDSGHHLI